MNSSEANSNQYIQKSSFIEKNNGDLKRKRQKVGYTDIKLEHQNFVEDIVRMPISHKIESSDVNTASATKPLVKANAKPALKTYTRSLTKPIPKTQSILGKTAIKKPVGRSMTTNKLQPYKKNPIAGRKAVMTHNKSSPKYLQSAKNLRRAPIISAFRANTVGKSVKKEESKPSPLYDYGNDEMGHLLSIKNMIDGLIEAKRSGNSSLLTQTCPNLSSPFTLSNNKNVTGDQTNHICNCSCSCCVTKTPMAIKANDKDTIQLYQSIVARSEMLKSCGEDGNEDGEQGKISIGQLITEKEVHDEGKGKLDPVKGSINDDENKLFYWERENKIQIAKALKIGKNMENPEENEQIAQEYDKNLELDRDTNVQLHKQIDIQNELEKNTDVKVQSTNESIKQSNIKNERDINAQGQSINQQVRQRDIEHERERDQKLRQADIEHESERDNNEQGQSINQQAKQTGNLKSNNQRRRQINNEKERDIDIRLKRNNQRLKETDIGNEREEEEDLEEEIEREETEIEENNQNNFNQRMNNNNKAIAVLEKSYNDLQKKSQNQTIQSSHLPLYDSTNAYSNNKCLNFVRNYTKENPISENTQKPQNILKSNPKTIYNQRINEAQNELEEFNPSITNQQEKQIDYELSVKIPQKINNVKEVQQQPSKNQDKVNTTYQNFEINNAYQPIKGVKNDINLSHVLYPKSLSKDEEKVVEEINENNNKNDEGNNSKEKDNDKCQIHISSQTDLNENQGIKCIDCGHHCKKHQNTINKHVQKSLQMTIDSNSFNRYQMELKDQKMFNDVNYSKLEKLLTKRLHNLDTSIYTSKNNQTINPQSSILLQKSIETITSSSLPKKKKNDKIKETLKQLQDELTLDKKSRLQIQNAREKICKTLPTQQSIEHNNKIADCKRIIEEAKKQTNPSLYHNTIASSTFHNTTRKPIKIQNYKNMFISRNKPKEPELVTTSDAMEYEYFIKQKEKQKNQKKETPDFYLNKVKNDIKSYSIKKFKTIIQSSTSHEAHARIQTEPSKCKMTNRLMPANNMNIDFMV